MYPIKPPTSSCYLKTLQANKEGLEQQLSEKIRILHQLRKEALELEKQLEKQKREIGKKEKELEDLQSSLASLNSEDPRHVSKTGIFFFMYCMYSCTEKGGKDCFNRLTFICCVYLMNYILFCYLPIFLAVIVWKTTPSISKENK